MGGDKVPSIYDPLVEWFENTKPKYTITLRKIELKPKQRLPDQILIKRNDIEKREIYRCAENEHIFLGNDGKVYIVLNK